MMEAHCHIEDGWLEQAELILDANKFRHPLYTLTKAKLLLKKQLPDEALKLLSFLQSKTTQEGQIVTTPALCGL